MAINSWTTLRVAIEGYWKRTDATNQLDNFIALAESDIWSVLRCREMEARATASASTLSRFIELPDGYIKMRQLQITLDDRLFDLEMVPIKTMSICDRAGIPTQFTVTSQIEFNRIPDDDYTIEMDYFRSLAAVTSSNATNDVLTNYPMIYLSGCLGHAFNWSMQPDLATYWKGEFDKQIAAINRKSRNGRFGPAPAMRIHKGMVI